MKKLFALLLAVLMLFSMASCVVVEDEGAGAGAGAGANPAATGEAADDEVIVIGYTIYEPMNYMEDGKLVGFDTELAEAVFKKLGYTPVFKEINWDNKYTDLNANTIQCIWNGFTANTADKDGVARADKVDFSYNYMLNKQVIVTKASLAASVTAADSLAGKVGAVENGSAGESFLKDNLTGAIQKGVTSQLDALKDLALGTVDFVVLDEQLAKAYVGTGDYADLAIVTAVGSDAEYYAIGFKKGSDLTAKVNGALVELAADGTIAALAEKYGVKNTAITDFSDQAK